MEKTPHSGAPEPSPERGADGPDAAEPEGGESACFAHLVCDECGALEHEGHRDGCSAAAGGSS